MKPCINKVSVDAGFVDGWWLFANIWHYLLEHWCVIQVDWRVSLFVTCCSVACNDAYAEQYRIVLDYVCCHKSSIIFQIDFCLLARADHLIMTFGTYGWWGAFLNRGIVIRQDICKDGNVCKPFGKNGSDFYLKNWLTLWSFFFVEIVSYCHKLKPNPEMELLNSYKYLRGICKQLLSYVDSKFVKFTS